MKRPAPTTRNFVLFSLSQSTSCCCACGAYAITLLCNNHASATAGKSQILLPLLDVNKREPFKRGLHGHRTLSKTCWPRARVVAAQRAHRVASLF